MATAQAKKQPAPEGFAERLRTLRRQKNLSQTEMARQAGIHHIHYGRYERGEARPSADSLRRLADALGVSSDYLMEGATDEAARARFEDRELLLQFQEVEKLPDDDKNVIKKLIEAFLLKRRLQEMTAR